MRSHPAPDDRLAEVTRRRLELLSAEIAGARPDLPLPRTEAGEDGPGGRPGRPAGRHARRSLGRRALVAGWLADRLPPTLQGRIRLGVAQLGVLAVTMSCGLAVTAWWVLRTDDAGVLVPSASPVAQATVQVPGQAQAPGQTAGLVTPSASASSPGVVVVDVAGKVRRPGIATLPVGSRVVDALKAAGGLRRGVDRASINLAELLVDGQQIVVGQPPLQGAAASAPPSGGAGLVNLNTADQTVLESLPGVGPVTAQAIIAWREEHGGFAAVDELLEVSGIGPATLSELAPHVSL